MTWLCLHFCYEMTEIHHFHKGNDLIVPTDEENVVRVYGRVLCTTDATGVFLLSESSQTQRHRESGVA